MRWKTASTHQKHPPPIVIFSVEDGVVSAAGSVMVRRPRIKLARRTLITSRD
jgi:hypothetical protein